MSNKKWAQIEVWVEYDPETDDKAIDDLFDAVVDAAYDAEPDGTDVHVSGMRNQDPPDWAKD